MILINYTHPLSSAQRNLIESATGQAIRVSHHCHTYFDDAQALIPQVHTLVKGIPLTPTQWQTEPILINPPSFAPATAALIAHLHGLMGYFPAIIRMRRIPDRTPPQFEVAEILNLDQLRQQGRLAR